MRRTILAMAIVATTLAGGAARADMNLRSLEALANDGWYQFGRWNRDAGVRINGDSGTAFEVECDGSALMVSVYFRTALNPWPKGPPVKFPVQMHIVSTKSGALPYVGTEKKWDVDAMRLSSGGPGADSTFEHVDVHGKDAAAIVEALRTQDVIEASSEGMGDVKFKTKGAGDALDKLGPACANQD